MQFQPNTTQAPAAPRDGSGHAPAAPNVLSTLVVILVVVIVYLGVSCLRRVVGGLTSRASE